MTVDKKLGKKDRNKKIISLLIIAALVALKLFLASAQKMKLDIQAPWDDTLMYDAAVSITEGNWLGDYNFRTLAKNSFFSLWVAFLHEMAIPYLMGGQLLWALASLAAAFSLKPVFKKRWPVLVLFAILLFSPSSTANPEPYSYITRVYRDNIFPALCMFCIAGVIGFALRYKQKPRKFIGWLVLCGVGFGTCWLCREDGWWLAVFIVAAFAILAIYIFKEKSFVLKQKIKRAAMTLVPFAITAACILSWCGVNYLNYGRFVINDFSQGEFADAYGAMTRIEHENWDPLVAVPKDVRQQLYDNVPAFAVLEDLLESEGYYGRYVSKNVGDYASGAFYWAFREAVAELGLYETPESAKSYLEHLATEINELCDTGVFKATAARSSVNPPIRSEYIGPVLAEAAHSLVFCATFQDCDARSTWTAAGNNAEYYYANIQPMEQFLHDRAQLWAYPETNTPFYTQFEDACFSVFDGIRFIYSMLTPAALVIALFWLVREAIALIKNKRAGKASPAASIFWFVMLGLLLCMILRALMIAFVTVSSFLIGTYVMYLATIHPLMLVFGFVGVAKVCEKTAAKHAVKTI